MTLTTCHLSVSLDGFLAGPDQSRDHPLGVGGLALHEWHIDTDEKGHAADIAARDDLMKQRGAFVMGRNMFGPVRGPWDEDWRGWWGDEPPYHAPVFVLTHHSREPVEMAGGTTFHFVTEGFDAAYARAKEAAGDLDVAIAGGASTVRQALAAGVVDEMTLDIAPVLLGSGERLLEGVADPGLAPVEVTSSPLATHVRYRIGAERSRGGRRRVGHLDLPVAGVLRDGGVRRLGHPVRVEGGAPLQGAVDGQRHRPDAVVAQRGVEAADQVAQRRLLHAEAGRLVPGTVGGHAPGGDHAAAAAQVRPGRLHQREQRGDPEPDVGEQLVGGQRQRVLVGERAGVEVQDVEVAGTRAEALDRRAQAVLVGDVERRSTPS